MVCAIKDHELPQEAAREFPYVPSHDDFSLEDFLSDVDITDYAEAAANAPQEICDVPSRGEKEKKQKPPKKKRPYRWMRVTAVLLSIILFGESLYCVFAFSDISFCVELRKMFIDTALETMTHRWLADYTMPAYLVAEREAAKEQLMLSQHGQNSKRPDPQQPSDNGTNPVGGQDDPVGGDSDNPSSNSGIGSISSVENLDEEAFYKLFWELNRSSFEAYLDEHPEALADGWNNIYINEAGLHDNGTSIYTTMGEQVLAIDVPNQILLIRVTGSGYQGVLAVAKDPSQLRCETSAGIGNYGQQLGTIVDNADGVLGMNASGFYDPNGNGNGGRLAGYTMCQGVEYGTHYTLYGYKRIELTEDNKMYITDSDTAVASDVTDAVEFSPSLIVDGEKTVGSWNDWNANNPRACIGQSEYGEIMMLVIEGRMVGRSIGTDVETCADILKRHKAYTAMNLDGGTTAVMYYRGEYVTMCSNTDIVSRLLPNAWVYGNYE